MSVTVIAEIGINHNGSLPLAKRLIDAAVFAGADAVKFQKRSPELCVPRDQWDVPRETPWGVIPYIEYRRRMEFGAREFDVLSDYCDHADIDWFASAWDVASAAFLRSRGRTWVKIPSAKLVDHELIRVCSANFNRVALSTGMSTDAEISEAVGHCHGPELTLMHCHSSYPAPTDELNLRVIQTLRECYDCEIGYSGHEYGIRHVLAAVALGATVIERHITLDHDMWGTDHKASITPIAFHEMVRHIRGIERGLGDGVKRVWESELPALRKLRGLTASATT